VPIIVETSGGEVLADGRIVDLLRSGSDDLQLLVWDGSAVRLCKELGTDTAQYVPISVAREWQQHVLFPTKCTDGVVTARGLVGRMTSLLKTHVSAQPDSLRLAAVFALATWFVDRWRVAPALKILGPSTEAADLLSVLRCLVRRGLLVTAPPRSILNCTLVKIRPTLLVLGEERLSGSSDVRRSDFCRVGRSGLHNESMAAALHSSDGDNGCDGLEISVIPAEGCSALSVESLAEIAEEMQPALLNYRLRHLANVQSCQEHCAAKLSRFTRSFAEQVLPWLLALDDDDLRCEVIRLASAQHEHRISERAASLGSIVIEAVLTCCHKGMPEAHVREIATITNAILKQRAELVVATDRQVGAWLKHAGLYTQRLGSAGRGLKFTSDVKLRAHSLARRYSVRSMSVPFVGCSLCGVGQANS
jgi:hypothetical protein